MTTRARDFKFAGTPVQMLQLAMVALTQKSFSAQYAWFSRGGSHRFLLGDILRPGGLLGAIAFVRDMFLWRSSPGDSHIVGTMFRY